MSSQASQIIAEDTQLVRLDTSHSTAIIAIENEVHTHPWKASMLTNFDGRGACNFGLLDKQSRLLGYFYAQNIVGEVSLLNIAVAKPWQGRGVGRLLLESLVEKSEAANAETVWLEVRQSNVAALKLYESEGFHEVDRRRDYYPTQQGKEDAIVMCLTLAFSGF
ncbi:ribosomal protein S18-alanine N-acetyltransferase [Vibrio ulleungensis]|uniref:[Ribosomal protein bS18]-alanine N-acetyltransferase n=1 Tax=Vibrio ulleungensis TaxID=2807619 RepID=A0ABS2HQH7_9VIBR|nr:ribosomal protein S18-alanine N-acetyltransferase [Vibrio ulleungensis]MBM7038357.1 ribosomal protein S18-alanine N-acetyltransferase [Vibrio ulleungensis]